MKDSLKIYARLLSALLVVCGAAATGVAADAVERERDSLRVISARAGGVNLVAGDVTIKRAGRDDWQKLTTADNLRSGDAVRTGADGRVEVLLNPGSYLRLGENSEFEFADTSLENLRLRLARGGAVIEATGFKEFDLELVVETAGARATILRGGLYRFNATNAGGMEVFVHAGRARVGGALVKAGEFVRVVRAGVAEAAAKFDRKGQRDALDLWSRERAKDLAKVNERLQRQSVNTLMAHMRLDNQFFGAGGYGHVGVWLWSPHGRCYTFLPFWGGWPSPYGYLYETGFYRYAGGGLCSPCLHPRVRRHWDNLTAYNPWLGVGNGGNSLGNNGTGGGSTPPGLPKAAPPAEWKAGPAPSEPRMTTDRSVMGDRPSKGDKP